MVNFFSAEWRGAPFVLFEPTHLLMLGLVAVFIVALTRLRNASDVTRARIRVALALALWINEAAWHVWKYSIGQWTIQEMLPLHLCSILIWLSGFMLIFKNYSIYEFAYFLGIGAGINALLTPDVGIYNFPHFRYIQTFISHGLLVDAAIYMTVVEGFRPTWKSLLRVVVGINLYMFVLYFVNTAIGSNYMMVNAKPAVRSLYDLMPPWPYYLIVVELLGLAISLLLYLPFAIQDWRVRKSAFVLNNPTS